MRRTFVPDFGKYCGNFLALIEAGKNRTLFSHIKKKIYIIKIIKKVHPKYLQLLVISEL